MPRHRKYANAAEPKEANRSQTAYRMLQRRMKEAEDLAAIFLHKRADRTQVEQAAQNAGNTPTDQIDAGNRVAASSA